MAAKKAKLLGKLQKLGGLAKNSVAFKLVNKLRDLLKKGKAKSVDEVLEGLEETLTAARRAPEAGRYSHLTDPPTVGPGKDFTPTQKAKIIEANKARNGGVVKSDLCGKALTKPQKSKKGVTPDPDEWQIDHINPKDDGGTNSYSNAQILSRAENRANSNKLPD